MCVVSLLRPMRVITVISGLLALGACKTTSSLTTGSVSSDPIAVTSLDNPRVLAAEERRRAAESDVLAAGSSLLPTVTLNAQATHFENDESASRARDDETSVGVAVDLPIFTGLRNINRVNGARARLNAETEAVRGVGNAQIVATVEAIVAAERSEVVLNARRDQLRNLRAFLSDQQSRERVGEASITDVEQVRGRIARVKSDEARAKSEAIRARANLRAVRSELVTETLEPLDVTPLLPATSNEAVAVALAENPSVIEADWREKAAEKDVQVAQGEFLPEVSVSFNVDDTDTYFKDNSRSSEQDMNVRLDVSVPLFTGGLRVAQVQSRRAALREQQFDGETVRRDVTAGTEAAFARMEAAEEAIGFSRNRLAQAKKVLSGVAEAKRIGARTTEDVLAAQSELTEATIALAEARYEKIVAGHELLAQMGRLTQAYGILNVIP